MSLCQNHIILCIIEKRLGIWSKPLCYINKCRSKRYVFCELVFTHQHGDCSHDYVIKWTHFPCYWPFVREIHRSTMTCPHKGQWYGALIFSLICSRINGWANNGDAGDLRRHRSHYDVIVLITGHVNKSLDIGVEKIIPYMTHNENGGGRYIWIILNSGYTNVAALTAWRHTFIIRNYE